MILFAIHAVIYGFILNITKKRLFFAVFIWGACLILGSIIFAGIALDQNFLRSVFHSSAALFIIFLFRRELFPFKKKSKENLKILYVCAIFFGVAGIIWVFVYGFYAIILESSHAANWIFFNIYTLGILLAGLNAIIFTRSELFTHVRISSNSILIDDHDYTQLLSQKDVFILRLFAEADDRRMNCAQIIHALSENASENGGFQPPNCEMCLRKKYKATQCSSYRLLYNQILKIKKIIETMNIGTIVPPENKLNITREGWVFKLFENVRLNIHP